MCAIGLRRLLLTGAALLAAVSMSACAAPSSAGPGNGHATTPAARAAISSAASAGVSPGSEAPSATPGRSGGVQNLLITSAEKSELTAAFVYQHGILTSDIAGAAPIPGSVYYAYDPTTDTYWALASFKPSSTATHDAYDLLATGYGAVGMFRKAGAGPWQVADPGLHIVCGELHFFPQAVLTAWALPTTPPPNQTC